MKLRDLDPFYGLIAPEKQNSINLTTIRSPISMYLHLAPQSGVILELVRLRK